MKGVMGLGEQPQMGSETAEFLLDVRHEETFLIAKVIVEGWRLHPRLFEELGDAHLGVARPREQVPRRCEQLFTAACVSQGNRLRCGGSILGRRSIDS